MNNKVLFISKVCPFPVISGEILRIYNLAKHLSKSWDIDIICPRPAKKEFEDYIKNNYKNAIFVDSSAGYQDKPRFSIFELIKNLLLVPRETYGIGGTTYDKEFAKCIDSHLAANRYNAILAFSSFVFGVYLNEFKKLNIACIVDDSAGLYILSSLKNKKIGREYFTAIYAYIYNLRWEKRYLSSCKKLIMVSSRDKAWLSKSVPEANVYVVENGVDTDRFSPEFAKPGTVDGLIIFTGVMNYMPNHDAMSYCLDKIWPLIKEEMPYAKLKIVGRDPKPELLALALTKKDVEVTGEVENIPEAVKGAQVFLSSIRYGSGLKSKIIESLAMGIPVVTTSEGAYGINFKSGEVGYITDDPKGLAQYTTALIKDKDTWKSMSIAGRKLILKEHNWQDKCEKLSKILTL